MEKVLFKTKQQAAVSILGLAALAGAFVFWCLTDTEVNRAGYAAAFVSAVLFAVLCLNFVYQWLGGGEYESCEGKPRRFTLLKIFVSYLIVDAAVLAVAALLSGEGLMVFWNIDSGNYLNIAEKWYYLGSDVPDERLVFFPGYPVMIMLFWLVTGNSMIAACAVAALFYALSGCMLYKLMLIDFRHEDAVKAVKYAAILPSAIFFAMPMSESLFFFLSITSYYLVRKDRWAAGGLVGAAAAFTRSLGVLVFAPIFFEILETKNWKKLLPAFIVPLGTAAYLLINYSVSGDFFKFMQYEKEYWGQQMGFFFDTTAYQTDTALAGLTQGWLKESLGCWFPNVVFCFVSLIVMIAASKKLRPSYLVWFICYYAMAIGATKLISAPRYLAVSVPLYAALVEISKKKSYDIILTALCSAGWIYYLYAFSKLWSVF